MAKRRANLEGTIYQRKDGRWVGALSVEGGKRKSFYGATRGEVHAKLVAAQRDQQRGLEPPPETETLGPFLDRWLETAVKRSVRTKTHYGYRQMVRDHITPALGRHRLPRLTPQHVDAFMQQKLGEGLSPKTVKHLHATLRRALGQAEKWGLVGRNVAKLAQPPAYRRPQVQVLEAAQASRLLAEASEHRMYALFQVALGLGLRKGELLGLPWSDVDLERRQLRVSQSLQRVDHQLVINPPKSERSRRLLPLPAFLVDSLRAHRVRQLEDRMAAGPFWQDSGLVFTSSTGRPLDERNVTRVFERLLAAAASRSVVAGLACGRQACECATAKANGAGQTHCPRHAIATPTLTVSVAEGRCVVECTHGCDQAAIVAELGRLGSWVPRVRFHDLRHSCASLLLAQGIAPRVVMEILGHSQISITMDTYSHVIPALAQDAVDRVGAVLAAHG